MKEKEFTDEFEYSESVDLGKGKHRQVIIYKDKEVGYLVSKEKNLLAPIEESYVIPDVEVGLSEPTESMLEGKKGWIDFKVFVDDYDAHGNIYSHIDLYSRYDIQELIDEALNG